METAVSFMYIASGMRALCLHSEASLRSPANLGLLCCFLQARRTNGIKLQQV
jgi:hypothetical protein